MIAYLRDLFNRHFSDPQVIILILLLVGATAVIMFFGKMLAPVIASVVIAYLLDGLVGMLRGRGVPAWLSVLFVFVLFLAGLFFTLFAMVPLVYRETINLLEEFPQMIAELEAYLVRELPERFPTFFDEEQLEEMEIFANLLPEAEGLLETALSMPFQLLPTMIALVVYLVLVPLMVLFFLKDKHKMLAWFRTYLPRDHSLTVRVWQETNRQVANYIRGKFWEILIVGAVTYVTFFVLGLNYAMVLAVLVGMSVLIPYIGAIVVTLPIALVAYFQFGWGWEFVYVMIAYTIIQTLDANVLFPLLFSKVVDLHPVAIIVALLFFGGIWGFWGIFFAIPLATLVKAVLSSWPRAARLEEEAKREEDRAEAAAAAVESEA